MHDSTDAAANSGLQLAFTQGALISMRADVASKNALLSGKGGDAAQRELAPF